MGIQCKDLDKFHWQGSRFHSFGIQYLETGDCMLIHVYLYLEINILHLKELALSTYSMGYK